MIVRPHPSLTLLGGAKEAGSERLPLSSLPNLTSQPSLDLTFTLITGELDVSKKGNRVLQCFVQYYRKQYNKSLTGLACLNKIVIDKCAQDPANRDDSINLTSTILSGTSFKSMIESAIKGTTAVTYCYCQLLLVLEALGLSSKGKIFDDVWAERMAQGMREIILLRFSHKNEEKR